MECSICLEAITKQTGVVTLSCEHSFHFMCVDEWFCSQLMDRIPQTCPCCRSEGSKLDRCDVVPFQKEEDDEDEDYEDDESETASESSDLPPEEMDLQWVRVGPGRWFVVSASEAAYDHVRSLFGPLNDLDADAAAQKIQAVVRGHLTRRIYGAAVSLVRLIN